MADDFEAVAAAVAVASGHSLLTFMLQIVFAPLSLSLLKSRKIFSVVQKTPPNIVIMHRQ